MNLWEVTWEPAARESDPATSHEAARSMRDSVAALHAQILNALERIGGAGSAEQIADAIGTLDHVQVGKRLKELQRAGQITDTGETRRNRSGRSARVMRLA